MKLTKKLNEFNRCFADALIDAFPEGFTAEQSEQGSLIFRGPIDRPDGGTEIGAHVAVDLEPEVIAALEVATPADRTEMTQIIIDSVGQQIRMQYHPSLIRTSAQQFWGCIATLDGWRD